MHSLMAVTMNKDKAHKSEEARRLVFKLFADNTRKIKFPDGEWIWDVSIGDIGADWFVIGGRGSGLMTRIRLDQQQLEEFEKEFGEKYGFWLGGEEHITDEQRQVQSMELFGKYFPNFQGEHPFWRNPYKRLGYDDDATICDEIIYEKVLMWLMEGGKKHFFDLEGSNDLSPEDAIGKKWVVLVDYHN
jgi:hypothetical protein